MSFSLSERVWERSGSDEMTLRGYVAAVTLFTLGGLTLTAIIAAMTQTWQPGIAGLLLVGLGLPIIGICFSVFSDNWVVSAFGYVLVVTGLGAITGPATAHYKTAIVMNAILATGGVTLVMSLIGIIYPKSLEHWGSYLFGALLALIFIRLGQAIFASMGYNPSGGWMMLVEYGAAVLFSLYIIFDWNRAIRLPRTLDNAVDSAVAIYLDVLNLFLTILRIMGASSSSSDD